MSRLLLAAAAFGLGVLPAAAGGYGCTGDCYRMTYVPPTYGTTVEKVMVRAPRTFAVTTPARYKHVEETVMVSPGGRHWSVTVDAHGRKVGCWVTTPPRYATVTRTVMVEAPQVVPYAEPAQYGYRSHTVMTSPGYKAWAPAGAGHGGGYGAARFGGPAEGLGADLGPDGFGAAPRRGHRHGYSHRYGHGHHDGYRHRAGYGAEHGHGHRGGYAEPRRHGHGHGHGRPVSTLY
ncbi:hypothetical protein [Enterovirga sp.]|uniref:hypothetical protein n=1 Tax=Enterovirga sp. TaxID=2026350 RepID=UPI0026044D6E|nr:hypothetical protein [Enterovirga sp.]MDB5589943.1 hypothetical protein [Enterovirga sp.]